MAYALFIHGEQSALFPVSLGVVPANTPGNIYSNGKIAVVCAKSIPRQRKTAFLSFKLKLLAQTGDSKPINCSADLFRCGANVF